MRKKRNLLLQLLGACALLLGGCADHIVNSSQSVPIAKQAKFVVIPFSNYTETPLAGERAMAITAALLESGGLQHVTVYQNNDNANAVLPGMNRVASRATLLRWASDTGAKYVVSGSVTEWGYKVGLDGEPVVGISIQLIELSSKRIIWTAVGSVSGGNRVAVTTMAQKLLNSMLNGFFSRCYRERSRRSNLNLI